MSACDCKECQLKKQAKLDVLDSVERKIDEKLKKGLYPVGIPKSKVKEAIDEVRKEVEQ